MTTPADTLPAQLAAALAEISRSTGLAIPGTRLVVAVSGGPDSLALLHALRHLLPARQLVVAHLDHQLRPESAAEATAVRQLAAQWGLEFHEATADLDANLGLEEAARQARYAFLQRVAQDSGAAAIVTGHNANDQAETVLMHILRGSGLAGLRGMQLAAPLPHDPSLWLLRPLLGTDRATIDAYCAVHDLRPSHDASNSDPAYFRNRLRHELLPLLRRYSPQIDERLRHLAAVAAADTDLLDRQTADALRDLTHEIGDDWLMLDRAAWANLPLALRRSTLRAALLRLRPGQRDVGFATLEAARHTAEQPRSGQQAHLPGNVVLYTTGDTLLLAGSFPVYLSPQLPGDDPLPLPVPGVVALAGGFELSAELVATPDLAAIRANNDPWTAHVALADNDALHVRSRRPGERLQPLGMDGRSRAIKQIMIDRRMPEPLRGRWPLVVVGDEVVWLVGTMVDHRYRVSAEAARVVRLHVAKERD